MEARHINNKLGLFIKLRGYAQSADIVFTLSFNYIKNIVYRH